MSEMDILFPVPDGRRNADDMGNPPDPTAAPAQGEDASGLIVLEGRDTPLPEVWVVWGKAGVDFVAPLEHMAQEHANDAAQDFPDEGPWRVHRYVLPVAASPTAASAQEPRRFDVFRICDAYESGIGHGLKRDGLCNPYPPESDDFRAYDIGYEEGARRAIDDAAPAQGEPQERMGTHWDGCSTEGGPRHYDCAVAAIAALRAERDEAHSAVDAWIDLLRATEAERDALRECVKAADVLRYCPSGSAYDDARHSYDAARAKVQP